MKVEAVVGVAAIVWATGAAAAFAAPKPPLPTCGTDIYVNTAVGGTPEARGGYALVSDGNSLYANGGSKTNKIEGRFQVENCSHDFTLNLNYSTRYLVAFLGNGLTVTSKFFNFDRVASVPLTDPAHPAFDAAALDMFCGRGLERTPDGKVARNELGFFQDN
jgi:hypothetical protein